LQANYHVIFASAKGGTDLNINLLYFVMLYKTENNSLLLNWFML